MTNDENQIPAGLEYPQQAYTRFYMCGSCGNHLLARGNRLYKDVGLGAIFCKNVVNVKVGKNVRRVPLLGYCEVYEARICCDKCKSRLGKLYFQVGVSQPTKVLEEGRFLLFLKKLNYWNGRRVICALTKRPF